MNKHIACLVAVIFALLSPGCTGKRPPREKSSSLHSTSEAPAAEPGVLQRDLMNFADRFVSSMSSAYDELIRKTSNLEARNFAAERKVNNVLAAYINAVEPSPIVGLLDMLVMTRLLREVSEEPWFTEMFGENSAKLVIKFRVQEEDIWSLGGRYLSEAQLKELHEAIDNWRQTHPAERYVSMVRLADFPEAKSFSGNSGKGPSSVFGLLFLDPFAGLDPAMREVERSREAAERIFYYLQRSPVILAWKAESTWRQALGAPELHQLLDIATDFAGTTSRFADSADDITATLKQFPKQLGDERRRAIEQVADAVAVERESAIQQSGEEIAAQRDAAIRQFADAVANEREQIADVATKRVANEREALVTAWNASLDSQRKALETDMASLSNRLFVYAAAVVTLGVALAVLGATIVVRHSQRKTS